MNKYVSKSIGISALAILSLASCIKDNNNNNSGGTGNSKLNVLFESLKSTPQTFTVTSGNYVEIQGSNGLTLKFHPESFLDANNNILSAGLPVSIQLIEALTYNDMLANRVQTATQSNQRLISGGSYHIEASYNGQTLKANSYEAWFPAGNSMPTTPMALFTGYETTATGGSTVMWYDDTTGTVSAKRVEQTGQSQNAFAYIFDSVTNFGWINCDYFYNDPRPKTDIGVTFPNTNFNSGNTEVYVVFPAINSTTMMYNFLPTSRTFTFGYVGYHIPIGETIHVVTFSERNENYYLSVQKNETVTNNHTVNVNPEEVDLTAITNAIVNL